LRGLDGIAYVRFASVYRSFKDLNQFLDVLQEMQPTQPQGAEPRRDRE
jgi:transcriptional repressor NrdR